ncbi:MAG TPA: hypothetical protein VHJ40_07625, partial [Actinomycetota bacterium]|nr:hypothetical protein [Actinomycetota bacterium]
MSNLLKGAEQATEAARRAAEGEIGALEVGFFSPAIYPIFPEIMKTYRYKRAYVARRRSDPSLTP